MSGSDFNPLAPRWTIDRDEVDPDAFDVSMVVDGLPEMGFSATADELRQLRDQLNKLDL